VSADSVDLVSRWLEMAWDCSDGFQGFLLLVRQTFEPKDIDLLAWQLEFGNESVRYVAQLAIRALGGTADFCDSEGDAYYRVTAPGSGAFEVPVASAAEELG
jgi:hypothetical protein